MVTTDGGLLRVLKCFASSDSIGFTELADKLQFDTDLTGYYLRKLQRREFVAKTGRGNYQITPLGKSMLAHAAQLSSLTLIPRISVMLVAKVGQRYIVSERHAQPFIGKVEWPAGPLALGEDMPAAVRWTAEQRLGLTGVEPKLHGFFRRTDLYQGTIFDDKLFAVHTLELSEDQLPDPLPRTETGQLRLVAESDLPGLKNKAKSLVDILRFTQGQERYAEYRYELVTTDFYE